MLDRIYDEGEMIDEHSKDYPLKFSDSRPFCWS